MERPDIFVIAGESSGDKHLSQLVLDMHELKPEMSFAGIGGRELKEKGVDILYDYSEINFIGFSKIASNYFYLKRKLNFTVSKILQLQPKALILCDFPGFNLRVAKKIRKDFKGKIFYYITPQVWAWHKSRIKQLKELTDACFTILPFEKEILEKGGVKTYYTGNPVMRQCDEFLASTRKESKEKKVVSLMPGSRPEEVARILPIMNDIGKLLAIKYGYKVRLISSGNISREYYREHTNNNYIKIADGNNLKTINESDFVITKFGTSNLECAFLEVPFTAVYKASFINYIIAKMLVSLKYVSLVNIVMGREVVKEFIQGDFTLGNVIAEIEKVFSDSEYRNKMINDFKELRRKFETEKVNAAEYICNSI